MTSVGFSIPTGEHPIVPIIFGDAAVAAKMAEILLKKGVYVMAFSFPVVPRGQARIRVQLSANLSRDDLEVCAARFAEAKNELGMQL